MTNAIYVTHTQRHGVSVVSVCIMKQLELNMCKNCINLFYVTSLLEDYCEGVQKFVETSKGQNKTYLQNLRLSQKKDETIVHKRFFMCN